MSTTIAQIEQALREVVEQDAPRLARETGFIQREPGWVMPKGDRDFTDEERTRFSNPLRRRQERLRLKWLLEKNIWGGKIFVVDTKQNTARTQFCLDYINTTFEDRPDLRFAG